MILFDIVILYKMLNYLINKNHLFILRLDDYDLKKKKTFIIVK